MAAEVIDHDDTARLQFGDRELLDPGGEALAVDRAVDNARGDDAIVPETGNEGQRLPMPVRHLVSQRLTLGVPAMGGLHIGQRLFQSVHRGGHNSVPQQRPHRKFVMAIKGDGQGGVSREVFEKSEVAANKSQSGRSGGLTS